MRELEWTADQVVITNGEAGYRYSSLAELVYGTRLADAGDGRTPHLAAIRREEVLRAGKILGVRRHYFLDQKDLGFATIAAEAGTGNWNRSKIGQFLYELLSKERYDAVFTLLPTPETHGHHRAATILALGAVARLDETGRPLVFGAGVDSDSDPAGFEGLPAQPLTRTLGDKPSITFDRSASFGYRDALSYQIVVNWVIAEHKSQGLFQNDAGKNRFEHFWLFREGSADAISRADQLRTQLLAK